MKTQIETYPALSKPYLNQLRRCAFDYSCEMQSLLLMGLSAPQTLRILRQKHDVIVWETERIVHTIGGPGCVRRESLLASFRAIQHTLRPDADEITPTIRGLGDAISILHTPRTLSFTLPGRGWWSVNLVALYVSWARSQYKQAAQKHGMQCLRN